MIYTTEQIEAMLAATTPGPWVHTERIVMTDTTAAGYLTTICDAARGGGPHSRQISNAALIAAAPTITAELIAARKRIAELDGALRPLAAMAERYDPDDGDGDLECWSGLAVPRIKHLRAARAALAEWEATQ